MAEAEEVVLAVSTAPDAQVAERIARVLLHERLIACANLLPGVTSLYRWQGEVQRDAEVVMLLKTRRSRVEALGTRLAELHPYEVPELIAVTLEAGLPSYLAWVRDESVEADEGTEGEGAPRNTGT